MERLKTYTRSCKKCGKIHKTTSRASGAVCKECINNAKLKRMANKSI